jgi:hypothetical protein
MGVLGHNEPTPRCVCGHHLLRDDKFCGNCGRPLPPANVTKVGNILIIPRGAQLPPFCIKCGTPTQTEPVKKTFA